ncbi:MAG: alkaline phosphatase PhoX [Cyanobacteria bacterium P01_G01_bin.38]
MSSFSRRQFLIFFGASAATTVVAPSLPFLGKGNSGVAYAAVDGPLNLTPVRLPHPLPVYQTKPSFLPIGINGAGNEVSASDSLNLPAYEVYDDVAVSPEYERYVIVAWGDKVFADTPYASSDDYVGYNNDYTGFVPIDRQGTDGYLWINHEYVSYPFAEELGSETLAGLPTSFPTVIGYDLPSDSTERLGEGFYNIGGSVIRIQRDGSGNFVPVAGDPNNRRYHILSGLALNAGKGFPTAWGSLPHQQGDDNYLVGTGPAATDVFPLSADGLGNRIIGTGYNCSGGNTPWGTVLSAEENFQGTVTEAVKPDGTEVEPSDTGGLFNLVGEKSGWMVEIDPADPSKRGLKHTALGRFRHENITFRVAPGEPLVAYMGDDRRGGHTWKFVSDGALGDLTDKSNSALFESGTLYVAKYNADGTGTWIPLSLSTPTNPNKPSDLGSVEIRALGEAQRNALNFLPQRIAAGGEMDGGNLGIDTTNEAALLPAYEGKTLADFYPTQGAVMVDAFLAANLVGGTPSSRPEDLEVDPRTGVVYIAYTDHIPGGDGYPDSRIFQTAKLSASVDAQQPSGGIYKIIEASANGAGTSFTWDTLVEAGEAGAAAGAGFANVDNMVIDRQGNVWGVTDMSTSRQNGFRTGLNPEIREIDHTATGGTDALVGTFGNNWVFYVPTQGADAGEVIPFGYGPPRCEMTGPTFAADSFIFAVQHPGEDVPIRNNALAPLNRDIEMLALDGSLFNQSRTVPAGSNWPSNIGYPLPDGTVKLDGPPRPAVIGIKRK